MRDYAGNIARTCRAGAFALAAFCLAQVAPAAAQVVDPVDPGLVVQTIPTSLWSPPSPDPTGITYRPDTGQLLTCDSEVDEMSIFAGANVWTHSNTGVVSSTATTTAWGNEPTGIAFDPAGGRLWITDDNAEVIYEVELGPDGAFGTADDVFSDIDGLAAAGCDDLEDVTYDNLNDRLYVASRSGREICEISPGPNGGFDDAAPLGDDVVTTVSLLGTAITAPRGIVYDPFWNTLVVADRGTRDLYELAPGGGILRKIDVNFPPGVRLSAVTIAPGSVNPVLRSYWVTDSGVDNGTDPLENDGRLFEVVAVPLGGNGAPIVDAGPAQSIDWPSAVVALDGFVSDDGHPYPPSAVASTWSMQSGPGSVTFGDVNSADTSATFSAPGGYVLELVGDDSLLTTSDTVAINLTQSFTLSVSAVGPGSVTLTPPGGVYAAGTSVTVTAAPDLDSAFLGFSGDLTGTTNPQVFVLSANTSATATFATLFDVAASATGPGTITLDPPGGTYPAGTVVTVTATHDLDAVFSGFSGDLTGTSTPQLLTVDADKTVSASFAPASYTLSVAASGPGSVTLTPPGGVYAAGTSVTVTAAPDLDSAFLGFSGDLTGTTNPQVFVLSANTSATATFATLFDVAASATGPGTITLDPPGGTYPAGTVVTVTATPDAGSVFSGFSGDLTGTTTPQLLTVDADKTVSASFAPASYTLSVAASGPGSVTLTPPGGVYAAGTSVTVTAAPDLDSAFLGFSGDLTGTTNPQVFVLSANTSATATFATLFDVAASATGPGTITLDPPGGTYPAGTVVSVTATPDAGSVFSGFSGDLTGTTTPQLLTVDGDKTVSASFDAQYTLSVAASGPGSVTLTPPGGVYAAGTSVTVTAAPDLDSAFLGFSGDLTGTTNPQVFVLSANTSATATFATLFDVAASATGPGTITLDPPGGTYPAGTVVSVTATPDAGSVFSGFSGDLTGTTTPQLLTVDADKTVSASFAPASYTLSVAASGPGSVTLTPPGGVYAAGTSVTVTAAPDLDSAFLGFSGDLTGTTNPQVFVLSANTSATATFATLFDVAASATGPGTITLDPPGGTYPAGTVVTVTATPDAGSVFSGFSGDLTGTTTPQLLTVDGDKTVSASFAPASYTLSVAASGPGSVTLTPPGGVYAAGTSVTVTAAPDLDSAFLGFSGDLTGTTNPQVFVLSANTSATATFATLFDVAASATGPGTITLDPPGGTYPAGTVVSVTATPDAGSVFSGFSGDLTGTTTPQLLTVDADKTVSASFAPASYTLSVAASGPGSVTLTPPGGVYAAGTSVTVTAAPDLDSAFLGFSGDLTGTTNPQVFVLSANTSATATFATLFDVAASATGPGTITLDPPGGTYPAGTVVSVTATPGPGATFLGFGGDLAGTDTPQLLTVDGDKSVSASFAPASYTLSVTSSGSGTVTMDPPGGVYEAGSTVTLTGVPASGFLFGGWSGDASGSGNPLPFVMEGDATIHAQFNAAASAGACGIGPELVALLPPLGWLFRRRREKR